MKSPEDRAEDLMDNNRGEALHLISEGWTDTFFTFNDWLTNADESDIFEELIGVIDGTGE